ncbi:MAG TPA: acetate--CoA ligase family protein [Stellaceae bacterium]|nr:acetate--CoA ligase family protein [Stellaceae bacterium]
METPLSVARLLRPRSVAIVGASPDAGAIGNNVLVNLERSGFTGEIHLVSRNRTEIAGRPCVRTIDDLPPGIDAVVLVVPEAAVLEAVEACVRRQAGSAVVFASGFAEGGAEGRDKQARIEDAARGGGLVLCGPNCIGFTNFVDGVALTFEPLQNEGGPRASTGALVLAQSGAMTTNLRLALLAKGVPVAQAISTGNEAVAGVEDFLADALERDAISLVALFIEQVRRPRLFLELMRRARAKRIPVVMLHPGRTARARDAALSHTGALAGDHALMTTVLEGESVLLVDTLDEMFDATALLARWPNPSSLGAGIVTNSGAFRGIALDLCAETGLDLPALAPDTAAKLKAMLPAYAAIDNPLDITTIGLAQHDIFGKTAQTMLDDPAVGALIAAFIPGSAQLQMVRARSLLPVIAASAKPVAFALFGDETPLSPDFTRTVREAGVPLFRSPDRALRATARMAAYGRLLERKRRAAPGDAKSAPLPGRGNIPEYRAKAWLAALGIAAPEGALARDEAEAQTIAQRIGFPVVLKAQSPHLPHKSDAGGVIVGIGDAARLGAAWAALHANLARARPGLALDGVLVEAQARPGLEMIVGARRDPDWGPVAMIGLGGIWAEALRDVRLIGPDLDEDAILAEIGRLKGAAMLAGLRGSPRRDARAVAQVAATLGDVMLAYPDLVEIEINPLVVDEAGAVALDALMVTS